MSRGKRIIAIVGGTILGILVIITFVFICVASVVIIRALTYNDTTSYSEDRCIEEAQSTIDTIIDEFKEAGLITDDAVIRRWGHHLIVDNNSSEVIYKYVYDAYINYHNSQVYISCSFTPYFDYRKTLGVTISNLYSGTEVSLDDVSIDFDEFAALFSVLEKHMSSVSEHNGNHFSFEDFQNLFDKEQIITDFDKNAYEIGYINKSYTYSYNVPRGDGLIYRYGLDRADSKLGVTDEEIIKQIVGEKTTMVRYRLSVGLTTKLSISENVHDWQSK